MKGKFLLPVSMVLVLISIVLFAPTPSGASEKVITWRMPSAWPPGGEVSAYDILLGPFADLVAKRSNGRLVIKRYPPDALVKVLEQFDAVSKGMVELSCSASLYHAGKVPEGHVEFGLPYTFPYEKPDYVLDFFYKWKGGTFHSKLNEAYQAKGIQLLGNCPVPAYGFMTKFPASKMEDFKGKKIRTFGLLSIFLTGLGAAPVSVAGAEQYMALQTGTVEATLYPYYVLETYKLKEVVKYAVLPPVLGAPTIDLYANLEEWKKLPEDIKKIVQEAWLEASRNSYIPAAWAYDKKVLHEMAPKAGVQVINMPAEEVAKLMKATEPLWKKVEGLSPRNPELINLVKEFLKEKGIKFPGG